jgi:hypothetical protein
MTSSTAVGVAIYQAYISNICQDATGGRTFVEPTNVKGFTPTGILLVNKTSALGAEKVGVVAVL